MFRSFDKAATEQVINGDPDAVALVDAPIAINERVYRRSDSLFVGSGAGGDRLPGVFVTMHKGAPDEGLAVYLEFTPDGARGVARALFRSADQADQRARETILQMLTDAAGGA